MKRDEEKEAEAKQLTEAAPRILRLLGVCPICGGDLDEALKSRADYMPCVCGERAHGNPRPDARRSDE